MKRLLFLICFFPALIYAQTDVKSVEQEINVIKKDTAYISAESTNKEWNEALDNAKILLDHNISVWFSEIGTKDTSYIAKARKSTHEVQGRRGTLYRAFVYVKKRDIIHYSADEEMVINGHSETKVSVKEDPTHSNVKSVVEEVSPLTEEIKEEPQPVSECVLNRSLTPFERGLFRYTTAQDAQSYVKKMKLNSEISSMGMYRDRPLGTPHYLYIYDKSYAIKAIMFFDGQQLFNLKTLKCDDLSFYKGCAGIWFVTIK